MFSEKETKERFPVCFRDLNIGYKSEHLQLTLSFYIENRKVNDNFVNNTANLSFKGQLY